MKQKALRYRLRPGERGRSFGSIISPYLGWPYESGHAMWQYRAAASAMMHCSKKRKLLQGRRHGHDRADAEERGRLEGEVAL